MNEKILATAHEWTMEPYDQETRNEVKALIDAGDEKELQDRFGCILEFGTGGMRGLIGAGTNRMNIYTVAKASQGLANYILKNKPDEAELSVAIATDSRRFAKEFSEEAASVLAGNGIKTYIFDALRPTPELSFTVRHLKCCAGIVVTASHNPKEYNGYKVYWNDGAQVVPPHDKGIIQEVKNVLSINDVKKIDLQDAQMQSLFEVLGEEIDNAFIEVLRSCITNPALIKEKGNELKIVYTPLHGTGTKIVPKALHDWGFSNLICEPVQSEPNGDFPSCKSPNPEEAAALERAIELAKNEDADLVLATDPDADRVGIAIKTDPGVYELINGNQIASMMTYYILSQKNALRKMPPNPAVIKTIVTTELISAVAEEYQCTVFNTLTGFKYIGELIRLWETGQLSPAMNYIVGGEESYGYLVGTHARDKDAVVSCCTIAEMTLWAKRRSLNLVQLLDNLFKEFGIFYESQKSLLLKGVDGMEKIAVIMKTLQENPPREINKMKVVMIHDLEKGIKYDPINEIEIGEIKLPKSKVVVMFLEDGCKIVARPSGTEPKIKFYFFVNDKMGLPIQDRDLSQRKYLLKNKMEELKKSFVEIIDKI